MWENYPELSQWIGMPYLWFACHWLAMSHSCYNPFIYCWMNARFRAGFCSVIGCILPRRKRRRPPPDTLGRVNTCATYISVRRQRTFTLKSEHQI